MSRLEQRDKPSSLPRKPHPLESLLLLLCSGASSSSSRRSPVPPNAPISRQRLCECAVMLRMLRHRIDRPSSRSFPIPVHSLYISDTQGRTRWEGSSPSLCPADHSAGILHSRLRLTAARAKKKIHIGQKTGLEPNRNRSVWARSGSVSGLLFVFCFFRFGCFFWGKTEPNRK